VTGKQSGNSFDSSAFLAAKVKDSEELILTLREQLTAAQAERARLDATVKELGDAIKVTEADRVNYERTLAELIQAGESQGSKTAVTAEHGGLDETAGTTGGRRVRGRKKTDSDSQQRPEDSETAKTTVAEKILAVLSENPRAEWTVKELESELPDVNPKVLSNTTLRLHSRGRIQRVRPGVYRLS
jgi:hypothetical protein